jgi:vacuolar-type H+-ATPase subunit I/STV1
MPDKLPPVLKDQIDMIRTTLRMSRNATSLEGQARDIAGSLQTLHSWIEDDPSIEAALARMSQETSKYFSYLDQNRPLHGDEPRAHADQALAGAEAALTELGATLQRAQPNSKAKALRIAWG